MDAPRRHFLGWRRAPLAAAEWLLGELGDDQGDVIVALPGSRAGRRLAERLASAAPPSWTPPRILTQGQLTDELVRLERPVASRLTRTLAWAAALGDLSPRDLARIARRAPVTGGPGLRDRLALADTVRALHGELAPEGLDFERLATGDARPESPGEAARWDALAAAQAHYRTRLAGLGCADPHEARLAAIAAGHVDRERRVVLVGVADMNHLLSRLLVEIASNVTVLVVAPEELADGFDGWGRLVVDFWGSRDVPLALERWHVVEKPVDQADRASDVLASWDARFAAEEVAVGLADEQVAPYLERRLAAAGAAVRDAAGVPVGRTRPYRLLRAVARFVEHGRYADFADLVRHPDLDSVLTARQGLFGQDPAAALDAYQVEHLPGVVDGRWVVDRRRTPAVESIHAATLDLLGEVADGRRRSPGDWADAIRRMLARAYSDRELDPDVEAERVLAESLRSIAAALDELGSVPADLGGADLAAHEALDLVLRELGGRSVPPRPPRPGEPTVELLGWLELPLDDSPALVVTGFQDGRVPQAVHGHAFLPDAVRKRLGLPDNDARLARDAYATTVLCETRDEVAFVTGRRSLEGDPLVPSRLAFHVQEADVPARVRRFLPSDDRRVVAPTEGAAEPFELPRLAGAEAPTSMSVSSFRTYLQSPYGYYLRYVLRLATLDDRARELDPLHFGSLAHDVLEEFGKGGARDSTDAKAIARFLASAVDRGIRERYGTDPLPAVGLQAEQLKHRFTTFAERQADRARNGWRIEHVEWSPEGGSVDFDVDGVPVELRGRIDRIDRHPDLGWAILDYKTGEEPGHPEAAHRTRGGAWIDLQLPLYRRLVAPLGLDGPVALGYGAVGRVEANIGFHLVEKWTEADLADALETARDVVRAVRAGRFEDVGRLPYEEILRAICGEGLIGAAAGEVDA